MRGPHVRFCERRGGVILRAYSTPRADGRGGARPGVPGIYCPSHAADLHREG